MSATKKTALVFAGVYLLCGIITLLYGLFVSNNIPYSPYANVIYPIAIIAEFPFMALLAFGCAMGPDCSITTQVVIAIIGGLLNLGLYAGAGAIIGSLGSKLYRVLFRISAN